MCVKALICLFVIAAVCSQAASGSKIREMLADMLDSVEDLHSSIQGKFEALYYLSEDIEDRLTNLTGAAVNTTVDLDDNGIVDGVETLVEEEGGDVPVSPQGERLQRLVAKLKRVENKLKALKNYVSQEASMDTFLASQGKKLDVEFVEVKNEVEERSDSTKEDVNEQLEGQKSWLASVDAYARSRNVEIAGAIYDGGIGSMCLTGSSSCRLQDSGCHGGICQCDPGFSYNALQQTCVEECRYYGDTFQTIPNYILRFYNNQVLNETTLEECKDECRMSSENFTCTSVEYFPRWRLCFLSDAMNSNETDLFWEENFAGSHYQRDCAYF